MREGTFTGSPEASREAAEQGDRLKLEERWKSPKDFSTEGVSREVADRFIAEKKAEVDAEREVLARRQAELEAKAAALDAAGGFSEEEERWFAGADAATRRLALQEAWESQATLDIEEVPASEKVAFADDRLRQLRHLRTSEQFRLSEGLGDRITRLELLRDQYAKEAEAEKNEEGGQAAA